MQEDIKSVLTVAGNNNIKLILDVKKIKTMEVDYENFKIQIYYEEQQDILRFTNSTDVINVTDFIVNRWAYFLKIGKITNLPQIIVAHNRYLRKFIPYEDIYSISFDRNKLEITYALKKSIYTSRHDTTEEYDRFVDVLLKGLFPEK